MKYVSKEAFEKCVLHRAIREHVMRKLRAEGLFKKQEVLDELGYVLPTEVILWERIVKTIYIDSGIELIPVGARFFNNRKGDALPERYILANPSSNRVAGFVHAEQLSDNRWPYALTIIPLEMH